MADDFAERRNLAQLAATRMLTGHGRPTQAAWLRELADWIEQAHGGIDPLPDRRGVGAEVTDLEEEVAALTGKPAAVLMPSGIMAQQAALRAWTERSGHNTVGMHDKSHFLVYELDALSELHGLRPVVVTEPPRPTLASDLARIPEPLGVLTVELPLRDCGHVLPSWEQLAELAAAVRQRGVPFHLDGARIWESAPYLGHSCAQIAELGDSVYVSLYKGLGGQAGAVLAGPEDFIADARRWRHRHGGNLPSLFPIAAAAGSGCTGTCRGWRPTSGARGNWPGRSRRLGPAWCTRRRRTPIRSASSWPLRQRDSTSPSSRSRKPRGCGLSRVTSATRRFPAGRWPS